MHTADALELLEHLVMSLGCCQLAPESHVFVHLACMICQALHYVQYPCDCISSQAATMRMENFATSLHQQ